MKRITIIKILFNFILITCTFSSSYGQYIDNSIKLIKKLGIRSLMVCSDSNCGSCPIDYTEYDSQGRSIFHQEAMMEDRWESFYKEGKEVFSIYYFITDEGNITVIDTTFYFYNVYNSLKYSVRKEYSDGAKSVTKIDTIFPRSQKKQELINPKYNKLGRLTSHIVGEMTRLCLHHSKGQHTLVYSYKKNGLIDRISIYKASNELYMTWYFSYTNKGLYRRK